MAHLIDQSNERDNIAYVGDAPWHGLGTKLEPGANLEFWIVAAGLGHKVLQAPLYMERPVTGEEVGDFITIPQMVANYRADTGAFLGAVDKRAWKMVQPRQVIDFYQQFAADGGLKLEVAGSLKGGARVWALAKLDNPICVGRPDARGRADNSFPYFLLTTGFDGKIGTIGTFTAVRVVCWNTISLVYCEVAQQEEKQGRIITGFNIPHCAHFEPEAAKAQVDDLIRAARAYEEEANQMAETGVNAEQALAYFTTLVGKKNAEGTDLTGQSRAKIDELLDLYENGPGASFKSARGTVWGLLQAITRHADFSARERVAGGRLNSAWFGEGKNLKTRALNAAKSLVEDVGPIEARQLLTEA